MRPPLKNKICQACNKRKVRSQFFLSKHGNGKQIRQFCKKCSGLRLFIKTPKQFMRCLVYGLKRRDKRCNITLNDLTALYRSQKGKCALSNSKLTFITGKGRIDSNISIDRINNNCGYTKGNIQLVCYRINQMKSNSSEFEFVALCRSVAKNFLT